MTRKRHAIALTLVMTAALCAEGIAAPVPQSRPQRVGVAARVMDRLTVSLRRVVPSARVIEVRREGMSVQVPVSVPESAPVCQIPLSPFQFRLPPPGK